MPSIDQHTRAHRAGSGHDARSRSRSQSQASSSSASSCSFSTEAAARPRATRGGAGAHQGHGKPGGACRNRVVWCAGPRSPPIFEDLIDLCKREPSRPARASPSGIPAGGGTGIPLGGQVAGGAATGGIWALACQAVPYPTRSQSKHHARSGLRRRVDGVRLRLPVLPRPTARRVGPAPPRTAPLGASKDDVELATEEQMAQAYPEFALGGAPRSAERVRQAELTRRSSGRASPTE